MDYGSLIRRAWQMTWRHPLLWVLGLFAPSTVGSCSPFTGGGGGDGVQWRAGPEDLDQLSPEAEEGLRQLGLWFNRNQEVVVLIAVAAAALGLFFLVVSIIAQGGMARATAELALDRPITAGQAWREGLRLFWRYLGLALILIGFAILVALVIGVLVALAVLVASIAGGAVQVILAIVGALLGLAGVLVAIPFFIAATVTVAFAQRAIAVEDVGPVAALRLGAPLLRDHLGTSALTWLINLALGIGAGVVLLMGLVVLLVPLGGIALVLFGITGLSTAAISFAIVAVVALILGLWLLSGIANTFFWNYWTLAYLRLAGRLVGGREG